MSTDCCFSVSVPWMLLELERPSSLVCYWMSFDCCFSVPRVLPEVECPSSLIYSWKSIDCSSIVPRVLLEFDCLSSLEYSWTSFDCFFIVPLTLPEVVSLKTCPFLLVNFLLECCSTGIQMLLKSLFLLILSIAGMFFECYFKSKSWESSIRVLKYI